MYKFCTVGENEYWNKTCIWGWYRHDVSKAFSFLGLKTQQIQQSLKVSAAKRNTDELVGKPGEKKYDQKGRLLEAFQALFFVLLQLGFHYTIDHYTTDSLKISSWVCPGLWWRSNAWPRTACCICDHSDSQWTSCYLIHQIITSVGLQFQMM